ncbi:hypothetical protein TSUD_408380 [Trifolium subterraneum]|uniref:Reverse transcriptase zinc-binding domain-containing protein n=1 Tax=Trifolium subterraneum TaxID=3900 RepID=A0A2Z6P5Q7_TRISU|nr:hypothetical protein TSUD_408380 [Trifolium subterraneum]
MEACVPENTSWIMKAIMKQRDTILHTQVWHEMMSARKFNMKKMYLTIHDNSQSVAWKTMFYGNLARPRALVTLWLACNKRLATRDRLHKFGLLNTTRCCFCNDDETQQHLLFHCNETKSIWRKVLEWIQVGHNPLGWSFGLLNTTRCCFCNDDETQQHLLFHCNETKSIWRKVLEWIQVGHNPLGWSHEMEWIIQRTKGKGGRAKILKLAFTECVYDIWRYRNAISFGNVVQNKHIEGKIIDTTVYRGWTNRKLRPHLAKLMMY